MAKFTIKDLAEGKCAVMNDGTVEELNKVLKEAFPGAKKAYGCGNLYFRHDDGSWNSWFDTKLPSQSVKDFLEELEKSEFPKKGDRILVSNDNGRWVERTFITFIEGAFYPVVCVNTEHESNFKDGKKFSTHHWCYWKPIEKKVLEVTLEDVAKQFKVYEVKIVEKK